MLTRLGRFTVRRHRLVLSLTVLFMIAAAVVGTRAFGVMQDEGFADPSSESAHAADVLDARFDTAEPNAIVVVTSATGDVDDPATAAAAARLAAGDRRRARRRRRLVVLVARPTAPTCAALDGDRALVLATVEADGDDEDAALEAIRDLAADAPPGITAAVGGADAAGLDISTTIEGDLGRAELIAIPITLILLLFVFRGLVAASLPLFVGVVAVLGTFLSLFVIGSLTDVSIYAINLTTALGLGLAIDYSLFIVSRYREELRAGRSVGDAVVRVGRDGRAHGGHQRPDRRRVARRPARVPAVLPALVRLRRDRRRAAGDGHVDRRPAGAADRRRHPHRPPAHLPAPGAEARARALLVPQRPPRHAPSAARERRRDRRPAAARLAVPASQLRPARRPRAADQRARRASPTTSCATSFAGNAAETFPVVVEGLTPADQAAVDELAASISALDGVDRVDGPFTSGDVARLAVVPSIEMGSARRRGPRRRRARRGDARSTSPSAATPPASPTPSASIGSRLPIALALVVVATAVLLFLLSGSLLVPLKALVLNALSLTATFGAMVWIFQEGNLADLFGVTATGSIDTTMPILMFCIAFGLSMDYEVFMLSRIKEEHDRTGDNDESVALGLERTGRIVTAAALLLSVTFFAFATSGVSFIVMFGLGLGIAVLMDAFVIRGTLVPALMKLAGEANWWAPGPLRRLHARIGIREASRPGAGPRRRPSPSRSASWCPGEAGEVGRCRGIRCGSP